MKTKIKEARQALINLMCEEAENIINNSVKTKAYCSCGWVDYIEDDLIQYEFIGAYVSASGVVYMVHKSGSEGSEKGRVSMMKDIKDIQKLEWILKGLEENKRK